MSLLKQIEDKGAVLEWSPIAAQANLVALGTKVVMKCDFQTSNFRHNFCSRILQALDLMTMEASWNFIDWI
jgi:hypothetical protein